MVQERGSSIGDHPLDPLARGCALRRDDALVLDQGKAVFQGPAKQLTANAAVGSKLYLRLNGRSPEAVPVIRSTAVAGAVDRAGDWLVVTCRPENKAQIVEALFSAGITILDFRVEEASVDDAVMDLQAAKAGL